MSEDAQRCFFNCNRTDSLVTGGVDRIRKIAESSRERGDVIHSEIEDGLLYGSLINLRFHKSCISSYTSKEHIKRAAKKKSEPFQATSSREPKRTRQSFDSDDRFQFLVHCFFCGQECLAPDPKHPERWNTFRECSTLDKKNGDFFKKNIIQVCQNRNDKWGDEVRVRVMGATSDLHAADARYHLSCYKNFMAARSVQSAQNKGVDSISSKEDEGFNVVISTMNSNRSRMWNSVELYATYIFNGGTRSRRALFSDLLDCFGNDLVVLSSSGIASIICFRKEAAHILNFENFEDDDFNMVRLAASIKSEIKAIAFEQTKDYTTRICTEDAMKATSETLMSLLTKLMPNQHLAPCLIGNIVTGIMSKTYTPLQVSLGVTLHHAYSSRQLIDLLYSFGICCSYDEVMRYKASVATTVCHNMQSGNYELQGVNSLKSDCLIQTVVDNFDIQISSANGLRSTHSLAMIVSQQSKDSDDVQSAVTIKRLKKAETISLKLPDIQTQNYCGTNKPSMPDDAAKRFVQPLSVLAQTVVSLETARASDFNFFKQMSKDPSNTPEYGGFMTKCARESHMDITSKTNTIYSPLLDMKPADHETIITAMNEAQRLTQSMGQVFTVFTADQQLYRLAVEVLWVHPEKFRNFHVRLGGMHTLMSFVGCVGTLMSSSGLEDVLQVAFAGVGAMLAGKKFPHNIRALRMTVEELLSPLFSIEGISDFDSLMSYLEDIASKSRTSKHWIDCLIKPVFIMLMFIRAEREGNWPLHLWALAAMIPYFFASGHWNYARYATYYLRSMEQLDPFLRKKLLSGEHVARHNSGIWNGIWTDMLIETTFMRFGKSRGGIKGITLQPNTVKKWALSLHVCGQLSKDVQYMIDCEESKKVHVFHKEESAARVKSDEEDRQKIRKKLQTCMNPLVIEDHPEGIVNIHSSRIGNTKVNVDDAVCLGEKQRQKFEESLPKGFYVPLKKEVVTLSNEKKHMMVQQTSVYNTEAIYARALQLMTRNVEICSLPELFGYELSPVPSALFDEFGDMNPSSQKSQLMSQLRVQVSSRGKFANVLIIDASALLWHVHWPKVGTIQTYVDNVIAVITKHVAEQDTFLVFDRYFEYSPKSATRSKRGVNSTSMQLRTDTPLPSRNSVLTHSCNKIQLTTMICKQLLQHSDFLPHKLVITGTDAIPDELQTPGVVIPRPDLETHHEEADVIIVQQAICLSRCATNNIKILSDDTDVFVMLVHFYKKLNLKCAMWMESVDKVKFSDIAATVHNLGTQTNSLLAVHCLTGCDTTSQFFGIGKPKALKVLKSGIELEHLGCVESSMQQCIAECLSFIAHCYGYKKEVHNMSEVRYKVWLSKKTPPKIKNLPPTTEAFELHIKRCHLQACTWNAAASSFPPTLNPTDYGWAKNEATHSLVPIQLPSNKRLAPSELMKSLRCSCSSEKPCSTARCSCAHVGLPCKEFCSCEGSEMCGNLKTQEARFDDCDSEMSTSDSEYPAI